MITNQTSREAALSFGDESSRAYHIGTVSHVVEEQRCACYTAEHVYQVGRALKFHSSNPKVMLVSLVVHSRHSLCEKLALNKFNANSDSNRPTPPNSARVRSDPKEVSMLTNCAVWTSLARALSRKAPQ